MVRTASYTYAFSPTMLSVRRGAALTVSNTTAAPHTVTADGGAFDSGTVSPNTTITMTFATPGTYPFHCQIHPYMTGTLTVT
jgi:plastocyanin